MELKAGYKQTEVGVIPEDWEVRPLGDLLTNRPSYGINAAAVPYSDQLPTYIRITDITEDGLFTPKKLASVDDPKTADYYLQDGDIVFARTGASVGKSYRYRLVDGPLVYAGFLIRIHPDHKKVVAAFLSGYFSTGTYWSWVLQMSMRSGQPGINGNEYAQLPIPTPPVLEQEAIAEALSDADALIESLDQLITKKRHLKQGAMQELLTGKRRLPGFSGEWVVKRLGEIASLYQPITISAHQFTESGYPVYGANGVVGCFSKFNHATWQVTVTCRGSTCGTVNRTVGKCWITGNAMVIGCEDRAHISKEFLYHLLCSKDLSRCITGTGQPQIVRSPLANFELKIAVSVEEQAAIATILSDMDTELAELESRLAKARHIKQGMMQELLTGRIRLL